MNNKGQQMQSFLQRAGAIINRTDQISPKLPSKGQPTLSESMRLEGVSDSSYDGYNDYGVQQQYSQQYEQQYPQQSGGFSPAAKNLPSSILESIQQNPIQEYTQMGGLSVLDSILPQQPRQVRQQVNENYDYGEKQMPTTEEIFRNRNRNNQVYQQPEQQYQQPAIGQPIDYSIISSIIKTTIAEEMRKLKQTILSESKQNGTNGDVIVKVGNGIQFITNTGNVYEGKLKLVGNVKD